MIVRVCSVELYDTELQDCAVQADLPPWILFSDFERAEWATQILSELKPLSCQAFYSNSFQWHTESIAQKHAQPQKFRLQRSGYAWLSSCIHIWKLQCWGP